MDNHNVEYAVLDHGSIRLVESWGSDERIIESARMSTDGAFRGWGSKEAAGDEKLLNRLWRDQHTSPFEMCGLTLDVEAPLFVIKQWQRHRTQSYNELSARYSEMKLNMYVPSLERIQAGGQSPTNRQCSGTEIAAPVSERILEIIQSSYDVSTLAYDRLLSLGLSRELARIVLPVGQYTRMRASANLLNWLKFLKLRDALDAQPEISDYATLVALILESRFPRTYEIYWRHTVRVT